MLACLREWVRSVNSHSDRFTYFVSFTHSLIFFILFGAFSHFLCVRCECMYFYCFFLNGWRRNFHAIGWRLGMRGHNKERDIKTTVISCESDLGPDMVGLNMAQHVQSYCSRLRYTCISKANPHLGKRYAPSTEYGDCWAISIGIPLRQQSSNMWKSFHVAAHFELNKWWAI